MGKFPKTLAAAGRESKGLKDLAAALWLEIPPVSRGGSEDRDAQVEPALLEAQEELADAGFSYALNTLKDYRLTASWVADGQRGTFSPLPWRDVSFWIHGKSRRAGLRLQQLDALIAEDKKVTENSVRKMAGKPPIKKAKTAVESELQTGSSEDNREIIESILDTRQGRKAVKEVVAENPEMVKAINRRRDVVTEPKEKKVVLSLDEWEQWDDDQKDTFDADTVKAVRHILNASLLRQRGYEPSGDAAIHLELVRPSDIDADYEALVAEVTG